MASVGEADAFKRDSNGNGWQGDGRHMAVACRLQVWQRLQEELLRRYVTLEEQMALCYPSMQLSPSPQELSELCKGVAAS